MKIAILAAAAVVASMTTLAPAAPAEARQRCQTVTTQQCFTVGYSHGQPRVRCRTVNQLRCITVPEQLFRKQTFGNGNGTGNGGGRRSSLRGFKRS